MEEKFKLVLGAKELIAIVIVIALVAVLAYNTIRIGSLSSIAIAEKDSVTGSLVLTPQVLPKGTPAIYGSELGISFDDVSTLTPQKADQTINVLGNLDTTINLAGSNLERYIKIASQISCEYCCGAEAIIFDNGKPACGCAHSYAMRGLAKYLITKHGNEFSDDQILEEMGKWKVLFFPDIHEQKAAVLASQGIELNYINLASNKYRGIEKGATGGGMVGGC